MADESKIDGNAREEVVLSPKVEGDSPTRNKQPLKLRFWPTDGKHLESCCEGNVVRRRPGIPRFDCLWGDGSGWKEDGRGEGQG